MSVNKSLIFINAELTVNTATSKLSVSSETTILLHEHQCIKVMMQIVP